MNAASHMPLWKSILLETYYQASSPARIRRNAQLAAQGRAPAIVLFYHRIADHGPNDWTMTSKNFARQVRWLARNFDVVSLASACDRLERGYNRRPCVSITFDDGYTDNCKFAIPFLLEHNIPFTYFVTTTNILEGIPFAHDVALGRPLEPNTPAQIRELANQGVEIGAHTRTHADIGQILDSERLHDEIVTARDELENLIEQPVRYFAFPYGQHANMSGAAFELARDSGYEAVCSAYGGYNFPGEDSFHLQRIHADSGLVRLKNWMTLDWRKLRSTRRFEYEIKQPVHEELCACE